MIQGTHKVDALVAMIADAEKGQTRKRELRHQRRLIAAKPIKVKVKDNLSSERLQALHKLFQKATTLKRAYDGAHSSKYHKGDLERSVMRCPEFGRAARLCGHEEAVNRMHEAIL